MTLLISAEDLGIYLTQDLSQDPKKTQAEGAIAMASSVVMSYCRRFGDAEWDANTVPAGVTVVVKRLATRAFNNPNMITMYTAANGQQFQGPPQRLLWDDEREMLDPFRASNEAIGTIRMGMPAYLSGGSSGE